MLTQKKFEELQEKIQKMKKDGGVDLSTEEDLSLAVMNLISLEEHFFFTGEKTKKDEYFDLLSEVREMRKSLLAKMLKENEGETWCIGKHLLSATMRLMEVGTKLKSDKKDSEAKEMFDKAYRAYSIFWAIRLKLINIPKKGGAENEKKERPWGFEDLIDKLVDCCDEKQN